MTVKDKKQINIIRRKKNGLIIAILFSMVTLIVSYIALTKYTSFNRNYLDGIYLVLLFAYVFFIYSSNNKVTYYSYKYNYLLMVNEDLPPVNTNQMVLTTNWEKQLIDLGLELQEKNSEFATYYTFTSRKGKHKEFGNALVCVVLNYKENLDMYDQKIQHSIKNIYESNEKQNKTKTEVVIQFKAFESFNEKTKNEIQKVIVFKQNNFSIVNITVGYFKNLNQVYYLRPSKRYPNKHYYYSCKLIEDLI